MLRFFAGILINKREVGKMTVVNMLQAETELPKLVRIIENKEDDCVLICRNGKPVAKIIPYIKKERGLGLSHKDYISMTQEEFDSCNDEIAEMFGMLT